MDVLEAMRGRKSTRAYLDKPVARETAPGWWPLRPARCSRRATPFGLPICST